MSQQTAELMDAVQEIADAAPTWADLSNALFDQENGVLAKLFRTPEERAAFVASEEYREIKALLKRAQERTGIVQGAAPTKSGKLLVRLPKSMHSALESEADDEGTSLNQLVVAKLAVQLSRVRSHDRLDWIPTIVRAYAEVRNGASEDRVIADPDLDALFLARCRQLGAGATDFDLNKKLLYARKTGFTSNLPKVARFRIPREVMDRYQYASELALRYVQRKEMEQSWRDISLDTVICDPILAAAFDQCASRIAPGFSPFQYRWGALGLRKAGRYMKEALAVESPSFEDLGRTIDLKVDHVPRVRGIYLLQNRADRLFIGETCNLQRRIERHLETSGPQMFPNWLYSGNEREMRLGVLPLPSASDTQMRVTELRAILDMTPILNYSRAA